MMGNAKHAENLYAALFNDQIWKRWDVLINSDNQKVKDAARALLEDIRRVLQEKLLRMEDEKAEIKEAAKALGIDLPEKKVH